MLSSLMIDSKESLLSSGYQLLVLKAWRVTDVGRRRQNLSWASNFNGFSGLQSPKLVARRQRDPCQVKLTLRGNHLVELTH